MGEAQIEDLNSLLAVIQEKELEGDDREYIREIRRKAGELWTTRALESQQAPQDMKARLATKRLDLIQWMNDQLPELKRRFAKYLD